MTRIILALSMSILWITSLSAQEKPLQKPADYIDYDRALPEVLVKENPLAKPSQPGLPAFEPKTIQYSPNINKGLKVMTRGTNQLPIRIEGTPTEQRSNKKDAISLAENFLYVAQPMMGIKASKDEFVLVKQSKDKLGINHLTYHQYYQGVKIYESEIKLHGKEGCIDLMMGRYVATPELSTIPSIEANQIQGIVTQHMGDSTFPDEDIFGLFDVEPSVSELVIYKGQLAYHTTHYTNLIDRHEVFTDAHTGLLIKSYKSICQFHNHNSSEESEGCNHNHDKAVLNSESNTVVKPMGDELAQADDLLGVTRTIHTYEIGGTYYMIDSSKPDMFNSNSDLPNEPEGVIWTIDAFDSSPENNDFNYDHVTSINNNWSSKPEAVSSQYNGNLAYEYFLEEHNRISINGQRGNIVSFVNVADKFGSSMGNAFWNGFAMFYGNGDNSFRPLARGLDVAGHEMTHGVVQNTANLEYQGESGALNESFADIFGAMIDRDDWLIGEDVVRTNAFPSGALRSLSNPNQGQPTNSFGSGWQPMHVNQQFNGPEDNNGVHINSGIPNHAFFRFASAVGKDKAERVYYRALDSYLTKSSQFIDARLAVIQAAQDLNLSSAEVQAARDAWDAVGVTDGQGNDTQEEIETNPGQNFIIYAAEDLSKLSIINEEGGFVAETLSSNGVTPSRPSVTDDGSEVLYIAGDGKMHLITINWDTGSVNEQTFDTQSDWSTAAISRDGSRLAATRAPKDNKIYMFDFGVSQWFEYELYNPTFSQDESRTFDVAYADALEFDYSGDFVLYDALNEIEGLSGTISYYDIGFLNVWNSASDTPSLGNISKLFNGLPEGVSIGNPTFSKNSEFIIAFDAAELNDTGDGFTNHRVIGANLETGDNTSIYSNNVFGFPSYSTDDSKLIFTAGFFENDELAGYDLGQIDVDASKIQAASDAILLQERGRLATWFSNGERDLVSVLDIEDGSLVELAITPNPASDRATLILDGTYQGEGKYTITDIQGRLLISQEVFLSPGEQEIELDISNLANGIYNLTLQVKERSATTRLVKQ